MSMNSPQRPDVTGHLDESDKNDQGPTAGRSSTQRMEAPRRQNAICLAHDQRTVLLRRVSKRCGCKRKGKRKDR